MKAAGQHQNIMAFCARATALRTVGYLESLRPDVGEDDVIGPVDLQLDELHAPHDDTYI